MSNEYNSPIQMRVPGTKYEGSIQVKAASVQFKVQFTKNIVSNMNYIFKIKKRLVTYAKVS